MVETALGIQVMEQLMTGAVATGGTVVAAVPFDNAHARIAIGDGNNGTVPTVSAADLVLKATTNLAFLPMNPGFPTVTLQSSVWVMTWQGTAGPTVANFAWTEWGIDNGGSGNTPVTLFNHKGVAMGTKTGGTWTFQAAITQT
jgi:hypothetical protein